MKDFTEIERAGSVFVNDLVEGNTVLKSLYMLEYIHIYSIYMCTLYTYLHYIRMYSIYVCTVYKYVQCIHMYSIYIGTAYT